MNACRTKDESSIPAGRNFQTAARMIYKLIYTAYKFSKSKTILYLDIEGHRNSAGGYDQDMMELQKDFILGFQCLYY